RHVAPCPSQTARDESTGNRWQPARVLGVPAVPVAAVAAGAEVAKKRGVGLPSCSGDDFISSRGVDSSSLHTTSVFGFDLFPLPPSLPDSLGAQANRRVWRWPVSPVGNPEHQAPAAAEVKQMKAKQKRT
ncbi:hypothetical protein THAOC_27789, partial [Thalassiosira oceanica]